MPLEVSELGLRRLAAQRVSAARSTCAEVVHHLGAVQAQDELSSRWALGVRGAGESERDVLASATRGDFLRTHALRGTWQLVSPADVHWLLELVRPTLTAKSQRRYSELGLDAATFSKALAALDRALPGDTTLTRAEAAAVFARAKIATDGQRLSHLLRRAELEGLTCAGPMRGTQMTIARLERRAPPPRQTPSREEAGARLAQRYFESRGPATLADFTWWSDLPAGQARAALGAVAAELKQARVDGVTTWSSRSAPRRGSPRARLLPAFDEFLLGYRDRDAVLERRFAPRLNDGGGILKPCVVAGGRVVGTWRRVIRARTVEVTVSLFARAARSLRDEVGGAVDSYARFLRLDPRLVVAPKG